MAGSNAEGVTVFTNIDGVDQPCDWRPSFTRARPGPRRTSEHRAGAPGDVTAVAPQRVGASLHAVTLARAAPGDRPAIEAMLDRCSRRSLAERFFRPVTRAPHGYLEQTLADRHAYAFLVRLDDEVVGGEVIGLAELHRTGSRSGDLGLIVEDAYHRRGIGTAAYGLLVDVAGSLGLGTLTADVHVDNRHIFRVLRRAGRTSVTRDRDVCHVEVHIGPLGVE